eukprot:2420605-Pyramimonas_sp.AAC.1
MTWEIWTRASMEKKRAFPCRAQSVTCKWPLNVFAAGTDKASPDPLRSVKIRQDPSRSEKRPEMPEIPYDALRSVKIR